MANILIVEDNPLVAKFYALALERAGSFHCLRSPTADEVLARAQAGEVDLLIVDVSLANFTHQGKLVDGLQLARLLKDNHHTRHIPILLVTAHAMEGDRERFLAASGADGYLEKPIYESEVLVGKVNELLPPHRKN